MSFKHVFDWLVKGTAISLLVLGAAVAHGQSDATATITIQAGQPGVHISSNLFGIFFEEINSSG